MENKHTPPLPWVYTEDEKAEMFSIHTLDADPIDGPDEFIACGIWYQSAGAETGKAIAELIVNSVNSNASLQSEIDRLTSENNDLTCKMEDLESEFNVEIDRLKEERIELVRIIQECKSAVLHCYEQSSRNGAHQEFLSEDRDLMRRMEEATRIK